MAFQGNIWSDLDEKKNKKEKWKKCNGFPEMMEWLAMGFWARLKSLTLPHSPITRNVGEEDWNASEFNIIRFGMLLSNIALLLALMQTAGKIDDGYVHTRILFAPPLWLSAYTTVRRLTSPPFTLIRFLHPTNCSFPQHIDPQSSAISSSDPLTLRIFDGISNIF